MGRTVVIPIEHNGRTDIGHINQQHVNWPFYVGVAKKYQQVSEELVAVDISSNEIQYSFHPILGG